MFDPNNPQPPLPPGMVQTMGAAPLARPVFDREAFRALDGRDARKDFRQDFRMDMRAYHDALRGQRGRPGGAPPGQPNPAQPAGYVPPVLPQGPAGMVGNSYAVQGMVPATSGFGLPTY